MTRTFKAEEIRTGYHPDGYRIDRTASPMNYYTKWEITVDGTWHRPKPVDFSVFPKDGWVKAERFDWNVCDT